MKKILQEDFRLNSFRSFLILFFYRITNFMFIKKMYLFTSILNLIFNVVKVIFSIQSQISYKANIGRRIRLPHIGFGVVISSKAIIGNDVTIYHLVTIGINEFKCKTSDRVCVKIGNNCYLSTGAKIISSTVGKNSIIGPNAVVFKDIPDNTTLFNKVEYK